MAASFRDMVRLFRALSDPTRLEIVQLVSSSPRNVTELTSLVGVSQPKVSRHLKILRDAGLLNDVRRGKWVWYEIAPGSAGQPGGGIATAMSVLFGGTEAEPVVAAPGRATSSSVQVRAETPRRRSGVGPGPTRALARTLGRKSAPRPAQKEAPAPAQGTAPREARKKSRKEAPRSRPDASRTPGREIEDFLL
ncbi:MAG: metalloregulator ArsR/SmtB family transcription factor [Candidatus Eisenbacteria bacterium]|nr:metalloregulator ArsR/SmtB family transcription factor [Candidatus Eisenbacteria bacterium]